MSARRYGGEFSCRGRSSSTKLHAVLLWTMGWAGGHLHEFVNRATITTASRTPDFDIAAAGANATIGSRSPPPWVRASRFILPLRLRRRLEHRSTVEKALPPIPALKLPAMPGRAPTPARRGRGWTARLRRTSSQRFRDPAPKSTTPCWSGAAAAFDSDRLRCRGSQRDPAPVQALTVNTGSG